jgi:hypothetical protein
MSRKVPKATRRRQGDAARWNGEAPVAAAANLTCAEGVVQPGTIVALRGGCDAHSGEHVVADALLRAELGAAPFDLRGDDFPLRLTVRS